MIHGTDVSSNQPNWKPSGHDDFAVVKTTEGRSFVSSTVDRQTKRSRDAGLVVGFYHLLWPQFDRSRADGTVPTAKVVSGTPEVQARWFVDHTPSRAGDLLVCDWEHVESSTAHGTEGGHATAAEKNRFLAEVKRLRPDNVVGLYVNASTWKASDKKRADFLWIAEYGVAAPKIDEPWLIWQSADHAPDGTSLDQDQARFATRQEFRSWITATLSQEDDMPLAHDDLSRIADAVLTRDGKIPNEFTGNADNQFVSVATALAFIGKQLDEISTELTALKATVAAKN